MNLEEARKYGIRKSIMTGLLLGFIWLFIMCAYALGFWLVDVMPVVKIDFSSVCWIFLKVRLEVDAKF